jgi:crossover junction endodeoxyribonuclease RusA
LYANVRGRKVKTKIGRDYQKTVKKICIANYANHKLEGSLKINIEAYPPDRRKRDIDNILKSLLDSVQSGDVFNDDSQIIELSIRKNPPSEGGHVHLFIQEIGEQNYG